MKTPVFLTFALLTTSLMAESGSADAVKAAAKKLGESANYSWTTTSVVPDSNRFKPGPVDGKTSKEGFTVVSMTFGDRTTESAMKDGKMVVKTDDGWKTQEEMREARGNGGGGGGNGAARGQGRGRGGMGRNFKTPAEQAADLAGKVKELKQEGDTFSGDLTDEAVKELLTFGGRRRDGNEGPSPSGASGSVKFELKDGVLAKYAVHLAGKIEFNGNEMDLERTSTTEIKEVGSTKVDLSDEVKKKIESAPAPEKE